MVARVGRSTGFSVRFAFEGIPVGQRSRFKTRTLPFFVLLLGDVVEQRAAQRWDGVFGRDDVVLGVGLVADAAGLAVELKVFSGDIRQLFVARDHLSSPLLFLLFQQRQRDVGSAGVFTMRYGSSQATAPSRLGMNCRFEWPSMPQWLPQFTKHRCRGGGGPRISYFAERGCLSSRIPVDGIIETRL